MAVVSDGGERSAWVGRDNHGFIVAGDGNEIHVAESRLAISRRQFDEGIRHLSIGSHATALQNFRAAIAGGTGTPDAYFLCAVATLNGRKAFKASLRDIRETENLVGTALSLEERGIFHYFLAYVRYDYYERKSFRAPMPWLHSLQCAWSAGVSANEIRKLFGYLAVENPLPNP